MLLHFLTALTLAGHPPADGETLLRAIHAAHKGQWFRTMTFVQKTTFPNRPTQYWYETMEVPGKLRLDISRPDGTIQSTSIFRNDSLYSNVGTERRSVRPYVHTMLVLIVDIHTQDPAGTIAKLKAKGYDLSKTHDATWQGRKVTVVGALAGDTTSAQFWVDTEKQYVVRMIEPSANGGRMDAHIGRQTLTGRSMVERQILIHQNGAMSQGEEYVWVRTDSPIEAGVFDPEKPVMPQWIAEYQKANGVPKN